jgi:hypothetical protein
MSSAMNRRRHGPGGSLQRNGFVQEGPLVRAVARDLQAHGYLVLRPHARLGSRWGLAQLIALRDGHCVFVHVGPAAGPLSRRHQLFVENVRRSGAEFLIVRGPKDIAALWAPPAVLDEPAVRVVGEQAPLLGTRRSLSSVASAAARRFLASSPEEGPADTPELTALTREAAGRR